jgi:hypothetical protein
LNTAGLIGEVEFNHCGRELNKVAYDIARDSFLSKTNYNWVDEHPLASFRKLF